MPPLARETRGTPCAVALVATIHHGERIRSAVGAGKAREQHPGAGGLQPPRVTQDALRSSSTLSRRVRRVAAGSPAGTRLPGSWSPWRVPEPRPLEGERRVSSNHVVCAESGHGEALPSVRNGGRSSCNPHSQPPDTGQPGQQALSRDSSVRPADRTLCLNSPSRGGDGVNPSLSLLQPPTSCWHLPRPNFTRKQTSWESSDGRVGGQQTWMDQQN